MASKTYRTGPIVDETSKSIKKPGHGHTHCPKCNGLTSSRNLTCEKCGKTRIAQKNLTTYVPKAKTVPITVHNALLKEFNRLQTRLARIEKAFNS